MLTLGLISLFISVATCFWLLGWPWLKVNLVNKQPLWWPWLIFLEPYCASILSWRMRSRFNNLQLQSGLANTWNAELWLANKLLTAFCIAGLFGFIAVFANFAGKIIFLALIAGFLCGYSLPDAKLRGLAKKRQIKMLAELPFMLDLLTLSVESGLSLAMSLQKVAKHSPTGPLRDSLNNAMILERTGMSRAEWLQHWAQSSNMEGLQNLVLSLNQADRLGMNLGPVLRAQAEQQRSARFVRAETLALQAPVKMLFPMVICIFPCTFLIIGFPIVIKLFEFNF